MSAPSNPAPSGTDRPSTEPVEARCDAGIFARPGAWMGGLIGLAAIIAYHNSFSVPFIFDDPSSIADNPTIRRLWPIGRVLTPPSGTGLTVGGRPILNLSLAVNYAISGTNVWSYHAANLLIHILAGLTLFGIVRRTLEMAATGAPLVRGTPGAPTDGRDIRPYLPAFIVALLWTVHPLQTESVTYIVQRAESLMGLFYLLTLYCFIRGSQSAGRVDDLAGGLAEVAGGRTARKPGIWHALAFLACLLGMATKEVMVSAPLIVFFYDRTFISGSFRKAWRSHGGVHLALAATWIPLGWLVAGNGGNRAGTVGFGVGVSWWRYAATEIPVVAHYLRLCFWPHPLILDYGLALARGPGDVLPCVPVAVLLIGGTAWALWRRPALGFMGLWFLAILAPTSLVPGVRQTAAEHRMYLALAPVVAGGVLAAARKGRWGLPAGLGLALGLTWLTILRNEDYRSDLALWSDTVAKAPDNPFAHNNLGLALSDQGRLPEAVAQYREALSLSPDLAEAHNNLGLALCETDRLPEAIAELERALRIRPGYAEAHNNLGTALEDADRLPDSIAEFEQALRIRPDYAEAHDNLGNALAQIGRPQDSIAEFREALRLRPDDAEACNNLAITLAQLGRFPEAAERFRQALRLKPGSAQAHNNYAIVLQQLGRMAEARAQYEDALRLGPGYAGFQVRRP